MSRSLLQEIEFHLASTRELAEKYKLPRLVELPRTRLTPILEAEYQERRAIETWFVQAFEERVNVFCNALGKRWRVHWVDQDGFYRVVIEEVQEVEKSR